MERNVIAKSTLIIGKITSEGDYRVDGTLEGDLSTKGKVIVGSGGLVKGNIKALSADIEGTITGTLNVEKTLTIKAIANISGDVVVGKLSVEPGATFNASCTMKIVPKEVKKEDEKKPEKKKDKKTFK